MCTLPSCKAVTLHRGRGSHHARKVVVGTREARPGPSVPSPTGTRHEGRPKWRVEPRSGVGPAHSTDEAAEGDEARRGKGQARGGAQPARAGPDAEPEAPVAIARASPRSSQQRQAHPIHRATAPRQRRRARTSVRSTEATSGSGSRWGNGHDLRTRSVGEATRPVRPSASRTLSAEGGAARAHPQTRRWPKTTRYPGLGGQDCPRRGRRSPERHLRGRLRRLLLWIPAGPESASGVGGAAYSAHDAVRELGA
jgi:hypothetical protein